MISAYCPSSALHLYFPLPHRDCNGQRVHFLTKRLSPIGSHLDHRQNLGGVCLSMSRHLHLDRYRSVPLSGLGQKFPYHLSYLCHSKPISVPHPHHLSCLIVTSNLSLPFTIHHRLSLPDISPDSSWQAWLTTTVKQHSLHVRTAAHPRPRYGGATRQAPFSAMPVACFSSSMAAPGPSHSRQM